jgi:thymidine kinase
MKIGKTIIKKKINFGRNEVNVEIEAHQGRSGNIFFISSSDKATRIFDNYEQLQRAFWSALVNIDEAHFLSLCVSNELKMEVLV